MKTIKAVMQESPGFKFMIDELKIMSPSGRKLLPGQRMMTSAAEIETATGQLSEMVRFLENPDNGRAFDEIGRKFSQLRDIHGTISNLATGFVADDIDLFELKHFALLSQEIAALFQSIGCPFLEIPALEEVVDILDPDGQKIPHFYIYTSYSSELGTVRLQMKAVQASNPPAFEELRQREQSIEERIRKELSEKLTPHSGRLEKALQVLSFSDLLIAKARQALELQLCKPEISHTKTEYRALFHPAVKAMLEKENKRYQPVDIELFPSPVLVTGANMGGKTVLLKTLYLAQYLFQFGFFVPAASARIMPVEEVVLSHGEGQTEWNGLSSFAAEMLQVDRIIRAIRSGRKVLALIDELARTTNPDEGKAIVQATLDILSAHGVCSVITTHYSGIGPACRKLKVKGLKTEKAEGPIRFENLNDLMDYSLYEACDSDAPGDGIRIAEIMGVDEELIKNAKKHFLSKK